ncbi:Coenzyme F420 hydrogenase/dehydrogenase, beta subunit C-terminal domain [Solitalea longa]|nr:Coenzyme F420 hydrogenase/dehydrogenase, beta subunit C-terminal domain [Solitalea longa]
MRLQKNGFFLPEIKSLNADKEKVINEICPGINIVNDLSFGKDEKIWGRIEELRSGYSTDAEVRFHGSSGGIISAIAIHALSTGKVDAVLQVGGDSADFERNTLKISKSRHDVLECASSRYAPALIFDKIFEILESSNEVYCFIGKPCDISALKNFLNVYPIYKSRFKLYVSIMCAGMPSFNGTKEIINNLGANEPVNNLTYRGDGWPGYFSFADNQGQQFKMSYNDSWGNTLNRFLNFRCKLCPDGIGLQADIAVGDAWDTKDGYPDFSEKDGLSLVIARTKAGVEVLTDAQTEGSMCFEELPHFKLAQMQPYQYARRSRVGARVLAYILVKQRTLRFKHLRVWKNLIGVSPVDLLKEFMGTFRRSIKYRS